MKKPYLILPLIFITSIAFAQHEQYFLDKEPFIHPAIIKDLSTHIADSGEQVISINLLDSQDTDRYFGDVEMLHQETEHPVVCYAVWDGEGRFCYKYIGELDNDIYAVETSENNGGSGVWTNLLLLSFSKGKNYDFSFDGYVFKRSKEMYLINRLGSLSLGDRFDTDEWKVEGNKILIGKDTGWFSHSGGSGGGWLTQEAKDVTVTVNLESEKLEKKSVIRKDPKLRNDGAYDFTTEDYGIVLCSTPETECMTNHKSSFEIWAFADTVHGGMAERRIYPEL